MYLYIKQVNSVIMFVAFVLGIVRLMPCGLVSRCKRFVETECLHFHICVRNEYKDL
jgi:hypothetical protein